MVILQASLNWTKSTDSEGDANHHSMINISDISSIANMSRPIGRSVRQYVSDRDSVDIFSADSEMSGCHISDSMDESDSVFQSTTETDGEMHKSIEFNESNMADLKLNDRSIDMCYCHGTTQNQSDCFECRSHEKAPSRQEKITDDTPQMHRTEESVWNSYAAKNLQALRLGAYKSEDSDSDANSKENENPAFVSFSASNHGYKQNKAKFDSLPVMKHASRKLVKSKSFSYPSDDESDDGSRYQNHVKFARKRSFCDVEQSPVRRAYSADTGLTQEFRMLRFKGFEPVTKRSHSLPRTRIRFNSGTDTWKKEPAVSKSDADQVFDAKERLKKIEKSGNDLPASDMLEDLSANDQRMDEGVNSVSELDQTDKELKSLPTEAIDSVDNITSAEPILQGDRKMFPLLNKHVSNLIKPAVSSLRSESEVAVASLDISSIHDNDNIQDSKDFNEMDKSVFYSIDENHHEHRRHRYGIKF